MNEECAMHDEIFDLIQENCEGNGEQVFETTRLVIKDIRKRPQNLAENLEERLKLFCKQNNLCLKCGKELEVNNTYERSEYQGYPADETINEYYCPDHGDVD